MRIGINGFGRIGRTIAKICASRENLDLVMVNDVNEHIENMAYLFKYDSTYGKFPGTVSCTKESISIDGRDIAYTTYKRINQAPWSKYDVDLVIDSSGVAENISLAKDMTRDALVKKVIVTHSSSETDREIIMGVNESQLRDEDHVISNSICDANAIAHVMKWIDEEYGIETGSLTTLHPWLSYQNLVDGPAISQSSPGVVWKDYALGRASIGGVIPKNTTAMTATEKVLPQLQGKIMSFSYRIPTAIVASSDIVLKTEKPLCSEKFREFLEWKISESPYVKANYESLISVDYEKDESSAIIDMQWLKVENNWIKLVLWYDNEWGYSSRVLDLVELAMSDLCKDSFQGSNLELLHSR